MKERKIGSILTYVDLFFSLALNILFVPLALYFLGTSEFGVYQLVGSLIAYLVLLDFGINNATIRFYTVAKTNNEAIAQKKILGFSFVLYITIAIILCFVGYVVYNNIDLFFSKSLTSDEILSFKRVFLVLIFNIAVTLPGNVFTSILSSHEKFIFLKTLKIGETILRPLTIIAVLFFSPYAITIAIIHTAYNCVYTTFRAWYCFKKLHISFIWTGFNVLPLRPFFLLASSSFFVCIIDQIFWRTNQIILGLIDGTTAVAIYSVASVIYIAYMPFSTSLSSVFFPLVISMVAEKKSAQDFSNLFIRIGRLQWFILLLVLVGFVLVGKEFIVLWVGKEFLEAFYIALIIMIPFTIDLIQNICLIIMQAQNTYMYRAKVYLCVGVFNIVLAIPFAHWWGGIGCASATALSMFLGNGIIMNYYYYSHMKLDIIRFWKEICYIALFSLPAFGVGCALNILLSEYNMTTFIVKIIIISIVYVGTQYFGGMNKYECGLVQCLIRKSLTLFPKKKTV